jgi:hypothetical protein
MICRICGSEKGTEYRYTRHQTLCAACAAETPEKVGRDEFERRYFGPEAGVVPSSIVRDFYDDYLASTDDLDGYIEHTTSDSFDL